MTPRSDRSVKLLISVDTEEDNWRPATENVSVANIEEVPRFQAFVAGLGLKPTYFTTYQVACVKWAVENLQEAAAGGAAEIAAHLHPWNTPPMDGDPFGVNTMVHNLPLQLQRQKLEYLTRHHEAVFGTSPTSFRAGRYGLGHHLVKPLLDLGYKVESSVTPFWDWSEYDSGPDFRGAPMSKYHLSESDLTVDHGSEHGGLVELPLSCGYNRTAFEFWSGVDRVFRSRLLRTLKLPGIAWRTGLLRRIMLSPEIHTAEEMLELTERLLERGLDYLQLTLHSSSLKPGLSPFSRSRGDVERIYRRVNVYVEGLARMRTPVPALVSDFCVNESTPAYALNVRASG